jgi:hypothetical protein
MLNLSIFHFSFDIWHFALPASQISQCLVKIEWCPGDVIIVSATPEPPDRKM